MNDALPTLIPEVYLNCGPRTLPESGTDTVLLRQRMDFLLLLDHNVRVVIETDVEATLIRSRPCRACQVRRDGERGPRYLRLAGYELYRFGAAEILDTTSSEGKFTVRSPEPKGRNSSIDCGSSTESKSN